jgi:hypothetical protein
LHVVGHHKRVLHVLQQRVAPACQLLDLLLGQRPEVGLGVLIVEHLLGVDDSGRRLLILPVLGHEAADLALFLGQGDQLRRIARYRRIRDLPVDFVVAGVDFAQLRQQAVVHIAHGLRLSRAESGRPGRRRCYRRYGRGG